MNIRGERVNKSGTKREYVKSKNLIRQFLLEFIQSDTVGAEVGVAFGNFSALLLTKDIRCLHLIDAWKLRPSTQLYAKHRLWEFGKTQKSFDSVYEEVVKRFKSEIKSGKVIIHRNWSNKAVNDFSNESLDWMYIDGDHSYEGAKDDLRLYYPKIKPHGLLMGDDFRENNGVGKAVLEFIHEHKVTVLYKDFNDGQFVLRKE